MQKPKAESSNSRMRRAGQTQVTLWMPIEEVDHLKSAAEIEQRTLSVFLRRAGKIAADKAVAKSTK